VRNWLLAEAEQSIHLRGMQTLFLGRSQLRSSRLAYGCWRIARTGQPSTDYQTARTAVLAAIESGYTTFDHADIYCSGRAEEVFGKLLRELKSGRDRMVITTKCGIRLPGDPEKDSPYRYDFSREYIVGQAEGSLHRLGIEQIDLYQLHRPDFLMDVGEVAAAFDQLHREGKVGEFGVSNFAPLQVALLQSALPRPLIVNQIELSLAALAPLTDGTLDQCQQLGISPLAWSPLGGGQLADGALDILPHQQKYRVADTLAILDQIAQSRGVTRVAIAIAWLLKHPSNIIPIIGSTNPDRIREAATATQVELSREEWYRLLTVARDEPLP
jgi:predicted oxidoreductase